MARNLAAPARAIRNRHCCLAIVALTFFGACGHDDGRNGASTPDLSTTSVTTQQTTSSLPPRTEDTFVIDDSPTTVSNGHTVTVTGRGCIDPASRLSEGMTAAAGFSATSGSVLDVLGIESVAADGSFAIRGTVDDRMPPGPAQLRVECRKSSATTDEDMMVAERTTAITIDSPYVVSVSPMAVPAGTTITVHAECPQNVNPEYQSLTLRVEPSIAGSEYLRGVHFKGGLADDVVPIPANAIAGTYTVSPECVVQRTPTIRFYKQFILTVTT